MRNLSVKLRWLPLLLAMLVYVSAASAAPRIWIVRHGQAEHNIQNRRNANPKNPGYWESHLTEKGKEQVAATAAKMARALASEVDGTVIIHSPLPRTVETAKILAENLGISSDKLTAHKGLIEVDSGLLDGLVLDESRHHWDNSHLPQYGGEDNAALRTRLAAFLHGLSENKDLEHLDNVILVTHGSPAKTMIELLSGYPIKLRTAQAVYFSMSNIDALLQEWESRRSGVAKWLEKHIPDTLVADDLLLLTLDQYLECPPAEELRLVM